MREAQSCACFGNFCFSQFMQNFYKATEHLKLPDIFVVGLDFFLNAENSPNYTWSWRFLEIDNILTPNHQHGRDDRISIFDGLGELSITLSLPKSLH